MDSDKKPIYSVGSKLVNWNDDKDVLTVGEGGMVTTSIADGMPKIYNLAKTSSEQRESFLEGQGSETADVDNYTIGL